jgi:hypothetical protein
VRTVKALLNVLEHDAREETSAQKRRLALLERQVEAVKSNRSVDLESALADLERELEAQGPRDLRRLQALVELARHWSCDARALTLGSVSERAGDEGRKLGSLRGELREATAAVLRENRRLAALVRVHRQLVEEVLAGVAAGAGAGADGRLVDAEA